jgi:hypothetical protein
MKLNLVHGGRQRFRRQFDVSLRRLENGHCRKLQPCAIAPPFGDRQRTPLRAEIEARNSSRLQEAPDSP